MTLDNFVLAYFIAAFMQMVYWGRYYVPIKHIPLHHIGFVLFLTFCPFINVVSFIFLFFIDSCENGWITDKKDKL